MTTIFISHSSRDDEFVNKLAMSLHQKQFKTWVDHMDTPDGMLWANVIQDGLEKGDYMVLVVTDQSIQSRHVRIEWQSFQALVKPIILLIYEEGVEVPKLLQDYPSVNWSDSKEFNSNLDDLLKFLPAAIPQPINKDPIQASSPFTKKLNPNAVGLNELQEIAEEIDNQSEPVVGISEVKLIIPKSDVSINFTVNGTLRIGRGSPHDVTKPDIDLNAYESIKTVSRNHATLKIEGGKMVITDVGSSNGTFVSGQRLKPNTPLKIESGTMVRFGALMVQIMQGVAES